MSADKPTEGQILPTEATELNETELETAVGGGSTPTTATIIPCVKVIIPCVKVIRTPSATSI